MFENQKLHKKLSEIQIKLTEQENWNDHLIFNELLKSKNRLKEFLDSIAKFWTNYNDIIDIINLAENESDENVLNDSENELDEIVNGLSGSVLKLFRVLKL